MRRIVDRFLPADAPTAWRISTLAGAPGIAYAILCVTGAPRLRFLTDLGAGAAEVAFLSSCSAVMYVFQFLSGVLAPRLASRKRAWIVFALIQRIGFTFFLVAPWMFVSHEAALVWCLALAVMQDAMGHLGTPLWISWMSDLLPRARLNAMWAARNLFVMSAGVLVSLFCIIVFDVFERHHLVLPGYAFVGGIGVLLGVMDIAMFRDLPEPHGEERGVPFGVRDLLFPFRDRAQRRFITFYATYQFAQAIAMPFLGIYMLTALEAPAWCFQATILCTATGMALGYSMWGKVADRAGERPVMMLAIACKFLLPVVFLLAPSAASIAVAVLCVASLIDGFADSAIVVSINGHMLKTAPPSRRVLCLGASNFVALGVAGGLAPLAGAWLVKHTAALDTRFDGYAILFAAALLLRVGAIALLRRVDFPTGGSARALLRSLRVRRAG